MLPLGAGMAAVIDSAPTLSPTTPSQRRPVRRPYRLTIQSPAKPPNPFAVAPTTYVSDDSTSAASVNPRPFTRYICSHDWKNEQRREGGADRRGQPDDAPRPRALRRRNPASDHGRGIGIGACLTGPETEPHQQQNEVARDSPGECGEGGPPSDDTREDAARSDTITQCAVYAGSPFYFPMRRLRGAARRRTCLNATEVVISPFSVHVRHACRVSRIKESPCEP